jgi:hypothetical protein
MNRFPFSAESSNHLIASSLFSPAESLTRLDQACKRFFPTFFGRPSDWLNHPKNRRSASSTCCRG